MKVTIAFFLVSLCMDVVFNQTHVTSSVPNPPSDMSTSNTTTTNTNASKNISTASTSITSVDDSTTISARSSTITPASSSTITTTSASRGSSSACMPPFLAVLSVVGFLLL